jgi:hypothetical protein
MIFEGAPTSNLGSIAQTLIQRLKTNHRCLYLNSIPMVAGMRWNLAAAGLDLAGHVERRALILSSERPHLADGKFDVEQMIQSLAEAVHLALTDGYAGLWAAGDMTWEFGHEANLSKLLEYEVRLDEFMQTQPALSGICLYHRDTLPAHAIQTALKTHPMVYVSETLSQVNPLYLAASA